jgi:hypothetical protein
LNAGEKATLTGEDNLSGKLGRIITSSSSGARASDEAGGAVSECDPLGTGLLFEPEVHGEMAMAGGHIGQDASQCG